MRIASMGHAVFSATMIGLGIVGLLYPDFVPVWNPFPASVPTRELFLYLGGPHLPNVWHWSACSTLGAHRLALATRNSFTLVAAFPVAKLSS
jgi:hypothetical protein